LSALHQEQQSANFPACPNATWAAAAQVAGLLSVKFFGAVGNGTFDDSDAVRRAINASQLCGGCVFFPPTITTIRADGRGTENAQYRFGSTVSCSGCCLKGGGGGGGAQGQLRPAVQVGGPTDAPVIMVSGQGTYVQDLTVSPSLAPLTPNV
jgi:hypothetical protein